ncbi:MAG TPA: hypothetical protein VFB31_02910 [Pseudolabrys sp.]|nr:hypothetical protein [Pseudolabrys sp.]
MTIYQGTITGGGHVSGGGFFVPITTRDVATLDITINPDGSFTGFEQQDITVTVSPPGLPHASASQHIGGIAISGNVNTPTHLVETIGGQLVDVDANFSNGNQQVNISGSANISNYNFDGISFSGDVSAHGALHAKNVFFTITGSHTAHEPLKLVNGQLIGSVVYTVSVHGDTNPNNVYAVTITNDTLNHGTDGASQGVNYQAFAPIHLNVTPSHAQQFTITVLNDHGADEISRGQNHTDGSVFWTATATDPLGGAISESANSVNSVQIIESALTSSHMQAHLHTSDMLFH